MLWYCVACSTAIESFHIIHFGVGEFRINGACGTFGEV